LARQDDGDKRASRKYQFLQPRIKMYDLINGNIGIILNFIATDPKTVTEYDDLVTNLHQVATQPYQDRYGVYWVMQYPDQAWRKIYFQELQTALNPANPPNLAVLATKLYATPTNARGQSNQFSFITKLVHIDRLPSSGANARQSLAR